MSQHDTIAGRSLVVDPWWWALAGCGALVLGLSVAGIMAAESPDNSASGEAFARSPRELSSTGSPWRACAYREVAPGETRLAEARSRLGAPAAEAVENGAAILTYHQDPFAKVELVVERDVVVSIVLHLKEPAVVDQIARELRVEPFEPVMVSGDDGQVLGRVYPERGLLLNYAPDIRPAKVAQLVLEPVTAEPFLLRAKHDPLHRYQRNLADLEAALQLEPTCSEALFLKAKILSATGQPTAALAAIQQALQLAPGDAASRLLRGDILMKLERHEEATRQASDLASDRSASALDRARAEYLLGNLLAQGPKRDFAQAIQRHLEAIKLATPLASDRAADQRRAAKSLLLDAFLAAAHDIAAGRWQQRDESAAKWLASAQELADAMIAHDQGDTALKLSVLAATLSAQAEMQSDADPAQLVASIDAEVRRLTDASGDPLFEQSLAVLRAQSRFEAASIEQGREANLKALDYARQAAELIEPVLGERELTAADRLQLGRIYFFVGSSYAVVEHDHEAAVQWYDKARDYLSDSLPASAARDLGRFGERFVSMGASYWESGAQNDGLELTRRGLEMMTLAAKRRLIDERQLLLPYENLAAMYKLLGNDAESLRFADLARRSSASGTVATKRR